MCKKKKDKTETKNRNTKSSFDFIYSPLKIAFDDKMHFYWFLFVCVFAFLGIIIHFIIDGPNELSMKLSQSGDLYTISVGVLAPNLFGLLFKAYIERIDEDNKNVVHFVRIKLKLVFIGFVLCIITTLLSIDGFGIGKPLFQVLTSIFIVFYAFICNMAVYLDPVKHAGIDDGSEIFKEDNRKVTKLLEMSSDVLSMEDSGETIKI